MTACMAMSHTRLSRSHEVADLGVIGVGHAMSNIQKHWDAVRVASSAGLSKPLQQALSAGWGQSRQLQDF